MGNKQNNSCQNCGSLQKSVKACQICDKSVCNKCFDFPVVKPQNEGFSLAAIDYYSSCENCFLQKTCIDFTKTEQIFGQGNKKEIIFLHGAGSSRKMFIPHAVELAKRGFRSILIDLPAHGARYKQDLTIQNCIAAVKSARNLCHSKDVTIIGGSLGGYILMDALGKEKDLCSRVVVMMAGQDVGVNRGYLASFGLWAMDKTIGLFSQATIAKKFMQAASKNTHLEPKMIEELSKSGVYFKHSEQNITLLKQSNPRASLSAIKGVVKCLFINGSQDHRDSQNIWVQSAGNDSKLIVYEGADHFFSHDKRYFDRLINDIQAFINQS